MELRNFAEKMIRAAGELALAGLERLTELRVEQKHGRVRDLVSEVDRQVELYLREQIKANFPSHAIVGEEFAPESGNDYTWVLDPIDGTVNYLRGFHYFSISVALFHRQHCQLGLVYGPALGKLFVAERGKGACCEGQALTVSKENDLSRSVWSTGMACLREGLEPNNITYLPHLLPHLADFRRSGSAALDLAFVAAGCFEGFWELGLNLYDVAAGVLLVEEAGGRVSDLYGGMENYPRSILASNNLLHQDMLELFQQLGRPDGGW